jgi:hypothetical protein
MKSTTTTAISILLTICVIGGTLYLIEKTDKIPQPKISQPENPPAERNIDKKEIGYIPAITKSVPQMQPQTIGTVVRCNENGKITYTNSGCKNGTTPKEVKLNNAEGIISPSRETIDATLGRMHNERISMEETNQNSRQIDYQTQVKINECKYLHDRNETLNKWSNQALTSSQQDQIRAEKYSNIKRQSELHC